MGTGGKSEDISKEGRIRGAEVPNQSWKVTMTYNIDESLLAKIKELHISPSTIIQKELRREVRRRERDLRRKTKKLVVNRYTGEVLTTR